MQSADYQVRLLRTRIEHYRQDPMMQPYAYYLNRNLIVYISWLLFAIGWSKLKRSAPTSAEQYLYREVFRNTSPTFSKEAGGLAKILKKCAEYSQKVGLVSEEVRLLEMFGLIRNDQAHVNTKIDFIPYFKKSDEAFEEFENTFLAKQFCTYLIPVRRDGNNLVCMGLNAGNDYAEEMFPTGVKLDWTDDRTGNSLFYRMCNTEDGKNQYYCLSPFIQPPDFIQTERPEFLVYRNMENEGFGSSCISLHYVSVSPIDIEQIRTDDGEEDTIDSYRHKVSEYEQSALFSLNSTKSFQQGKKWNQSRFDKVFLNCSTYPGFARVLNNKFNYCLEICPVRDEVISFCLDSNRLVATVMGNGGVGKTSLILSIIRDLSSKRTTCGYSNIIFFSAKRQFYSFEHHKTINREDEADIHNYKDLVTKLSVLLELEPDEELSVSADRIVECIRRISASPASGRRRFLLTIDDLDSLECGDQEQILKLVYRFDASTVKTIITSRNNQQESPIHFAVRELNMDQSMQFAKWYAKTVFQMPSWNAWVGSQRAEKWVRNCGEGNPLIIQMLLHLVKDGLEPAIVFPATRSERAAYLYGTINNLLNTEEKWVFHICRCLYSSLPESERRSDMLVSVLLYLAVGCGVREGDFSAILKRLADLKLILPSHNGELFQPFSDLILMSSVQRIQNPPVPRFYDLVWQDVKVHPERWLSFSNVEGMLLQFIRSVESDPLFDIVIAKHILEYISANVSIRRDLYEEIDVWLNCHTVGSGDGPNDMDQKIDRFIQSVEKKAEELMRLSGEEGNFEALRSSYSDYVRELKKLLNKCPKPEISRRLMVVQNQMDEAGF